MDASANTIEYTDEQIIKNIEFFQYCLDKETTNDYYLPMYCNEIIRIISKNGYLSKLGKQIINYDIHDLIEDNKDLDKLLKAILYFTACYNLFILTVGFIMNIDEDQSKQYVERLTPSIVDFTKSLQPRIQPLCIAMSKLLESGLQQLDDKRAYIYDGMKRKLFNQDNYEQSPLYMPDIETEVREDKTKDAVPIN